MAVDVLLGLQWGDEGKGKIVDYLADRYHAIARFQGGPNAGHTLYYHDKKIVLHHTPSGIFHAHLINIIGNGVVIDPASFQVEIAEIKETGVPVESRLFIDKKAHLILPTHKILDAASEAAKGKDKIGSTLRGISPAYMDKIGRNGLRVGDTLREDFENLYKSLKNKHLGILRQYPHFEYDLAPLEEAWWAGIEHLRQMNLINGAYFFQEILNKKQHILAEGAQGTMLDIDFGTYPYVTSSNTTSAGVCSGLGVPPTALREVIGITKAYTTRVGSGPFPTELHGEIGEKLRKAGNEFGATTGRPRRCGWLDLPALRYAAMINGVTQIVMTKADVLADFDELKVCVAYEYEGQEEEHYELPYNLESPLLKPRYTVLKGWEDVDWSGYQTLNALPESLKNYIDFVAGELGIPITCVSVGPKREQLITSF